MRISQKDQAWRRRPEYDAEECYSYFRGELSRGVRFYIKGPHQKEDEMRILKGLVCANCLEPFPAMPRADTLQLFIDANVRYPQPDWKNLIREGRCPCCRDEVSYEYANLLHEGTLPTPEWMKE